MISRPELYRSHKFLYYMEVVKLVQTLTPYHSQSNQATSPPDNGRRRHYMLKKEEEEFKVALMRFVSLGNIKIFSLRLMLWEGPIYSFRDGKRLENRAYQTYRDTATEMFLFEDSNEQAKILAEAIEMYWTPQSARYMLMELY